MLDILPYSLLLGLHLLFVTIFLSGLMIGALLLPPLQRSADKAGKRAEIVRLHRLMGMMTTPALILVWVFGGSMAIALGWYQAGWMQAKIVAVIALTWLHLHQFQASRALLRGKTVSRSGSYRPLAAAALLAILIATLVIAKPDIPALLSF